MPSGTRKSNVYRFISQVMERLENTEFREGKFKYYINPLPRGVQQWGLCNLDPEHNVVVIMTASITHHIDNKRISKSLLRPPCQTVKGDTKLSMIHKKGENEGGLVWLVCSYRLVNTFPLEILL